MVGNGHGLIEILSRYLAGKSNKCISIRTGGLNVIHFPYTWLDNDLNSQPIVSVLNILMLFTFCQL